MIHGASIATGLAALLGLVSALVSAQSGLQTLSWDAPVWVALLHLFLAATKAGTSLALLVRPTVLTRWCFVGLFAIAAIVDVSTYLELGLLRLQRLLLTPGALLMGATCLLLARKKAEGEQEP